MLRMLVRTGDTSAGDQRQKLLFISLNTICSCIPATVSANIASRTYSNHTYRVLGLLACSAMAPKLSQQDVNSVVCSLRDE